MWLYITNKIYTHKYTFVTDEMEDLDNLYWWSESETPT